jgi:hypothetical protein
VIAIGAAMLCRDTAVESSRQARKSGPFATSGAAMALDGIFSFILFGKER